MEEQKDLTTEEVKKVSGGAESGPKRKITCPNCGVTYTAGTRHTCTSVPPPK